jgi:hypothetical protein
MQCYLYISFLGYMQIGRWWKFRWVRHWHGGERSTDFYEVVGEGFKCKGAKINQDDSQFPYSQKLGKLVELVGLWIMARGILALSLSSVLVIVSSLRVLPNTCSP